MEIKIKKLNEEAIIPKYATNKSAGADLSACIEKEIIVKPFSQVTINTGLAIEIPDGFVGLIFSRSGLSTKKGLALANKVGVIDSDYRGEWLIVLYNQSNQEQVIKPQERIAQFVIVPYYKAEFILTDELSVTKRNAGGFGSTGSFN